jgi:hypothetical protein
VRGGRRRRRLCWGVQWALDLIPTPDALESAGVVDTRTGEGVAGDAGKKGRGMLPTPDLYICDMRRPGASALSSSPVKDPRANITSIRTLRHGEQLGRGRMKIKND